MFPWFVPPKIDEKTLLQIDSSMIVGVLFFLTLTSFVGAHQAYGKVTLGLITLTIIAPFVLSALTIFRSNDPKKAQRLTATGLVYLPAILTVIILSPVVPDLSDGDYSIEDVDQQCARNPEAFNVTHSWKCSEFSPGSLAEECARNPSGFNVSIKGCSGLRVPV